MAGTIIADFIRTDANRLSLQVGNTTFATINAMGLLSNTGTTIIAANGVISGAGTISKSALPSGSILQVVSNTFSTYASSSSSTFADTGLTASITPSSASNKILVIAAIAGIAKLNNTSVQLRLVRDATTISTIESGAGYTNDASWNRVAGSSVSYLDSPATTSSTTYKIQFASADNIATAYVQLDPAMSTITLMEIAV